MPVFTRRSGTSSTATVVASEPLPVVVGIARWGKQRPGRPAGLADRRVDVRHHRSGTGDDEVGHLRRVDRRAAADGDEAVHPRVGRERRGLLERRERRLHVRPVVDDDVDPGRGDGGPHALGVPGRGDAGVGDQQRSAHAEPLELPARVRHRARPELHRRGLRREDGLLHVSRSSAARSRAGGGAGRRVARSTKTWTNQPSAAGSSAPGREDGELVADARRPEVADAQLDLHVAGEGQRRVIGAVRLRAQPDHLAALRTSSAPSFTSHALIAVSKNAK